MPFFPHFFMRELLLWLVTLNLLGALAVFFPAHLGIEADPFAPAPAGIKPEWYFLATYQFLKYMPPTLGMFEGEQLGLLLFAFGGLLWCLVPWIDRGKSERIAMLVKVGGILTIVFLVAMTALGFMVE